MTKSWKTLLETLPDISPSTNLEINLRRVIVHDLFFRKITRWFSVAFFWAGVVSIPMASVMAFQRAVGNGFWTYAKLIFSDTTVVLGEWRSFSILIAETIPWNELIWLSAGIAVSLWLRHWIRMNRPSLIISNSQKISI